MVLIFGNPIFFIASVYCVSDLKNDFVIVVVVVVLGSELFSKFPQNWKIMQHGSFIPD